LNWINEMKVTILVHMSHLSILQYKLNDAFQALKTCMEYCDSHPLIWDNLNEQILISWAFLFRK
jgi:hypothetical protein